MYTCNAEVLEVLHISWNMGTCPQSAVLGLQANISDKSLMPMLQLRITHHILHWSIKVLIIVFTQQCHNGISVPVSLDGITFPFLLASMESNQQLSTGTRQFT